MSLLIQRPSDKGPDHNKFIRTCGCLSRMSTSSRMTMTVAELPAGAAGAASATLMAAGALHLRPSLLPPPPPPPLPLLLEVLLSPERRLPPDRV